MNSEAPSLPLVPPTPQFPAPDSLSSEQRLAFIDGYRKRMSGGEELTVDELRHALDVARFDRASAQKERKTATKEAKATMVAPSLDDL